MRVKDASDNIIDGLIKKDNGSIIVDKSDSYNRYMQHKKQAERLVSLSEDSETNSLKLNELETSINNINKDVTDIKSLLQQLLYK
jgi:hypothetical protein